jgi:Fur family ferric uptake transcriptional regulator
MEGMVITGERRLRAAGKRITPQRKLVLGILSQADGHLDAHEIYEQGRRQDSSLSLSTVYRTLSVLKEIGFVQELHLDGEHHHYELDSKGEHSHLICIQCGEVIEIDSTAFVAAASQAAAEHGFRIASTQVELGGCCAKCQKKEHATEQENPTR